MVTLDHPDATNEMAVVVAEAVDERIRQDTKWGTSFPGRSHDRWLTILTEEAGEAAEALSAAMRHDAFLRKLQEHIGRTAEAILQSDGTPDDRVQTLADVRREVVQVAAVALSWLEHGQWHERPRNASGRVVCETCGEEAAYCGQRHGQGGGA